MAVQAGIALAGIVQAGIVQAEAAVEARRIAPPSLERVALSLKEKQQEEPMEFEEQEGAPSAILYEHSVGWPFCWFFA